METLSIETLKGFLSSQYKGWSSFVDNIIFPIFGEDNFESLSETELLENNPEEKPLAEATGICSIKQVGQIDIGVQPLQIFDVTVSDRVMMERNRVNIQRLIRKVMENYSSAFMLFHYENDTRWDWRFTFCHKKGSQKEVTDSKRYTFLLGPGQSCRTAANNFNKLYENRDTLDMSKIEEAFSVEALTNEFFGKYKKEYDKFVEYITGKRYVKKGNKYVEAIIHEPHPTLYPCFSNNDKLVRDYVKKMLGRIVFLHFLQKKGWLGVPYNEEWGSGDRNFMLNLFKKATEKQQENFLDEVLEGLFAEGLDCNRADKSDLYDTKVEGFRKCRIPYLNGGLFERDYLDELAVRFPAEYFDSLLTMLSQYNFTIDENDPNDAEVGVDPEMLGRIFENLLEDNKDKGAFYTPKEIVQYMCRESLIAYLQTDQNEEDKETIRKFVTTHDAELLGDLKSDIEQKLLDVKICDPAIGSGAFPMGLLRELFFCRSAIEPNIIENAANIKRYIIQNNIYGVDIERGAVDIARLRFWLALIVDEKTPEALPNLDFKIMQGNSLLEQYNGADLSTMTEKKVGAEQSCSIFDSMLDVYRRNLRNKLSEYYSCPEHTKKVQLRKDIADIVKQELTEQGIHIDFEDIDLSANTHFFLWHTWFHDVFSRPSKEGFDIVIGNPPYIEAKKLKHIASYLKEKFIVYSGTADLSIYFNELGLNLLAEKGIISYITTNKFFNTQYGEKVRNQLSSQHINTILNFEQVEVFEDVLVSSVIFNISKRNKKPKNLFIYEKFYKLKFQEFKRQFVERQNLFGVYSQDHLNNKEWSFSDMTQLMLKEKIEKKHLLLKDVEGVKIYRGVTTGYNPAFIISNEQRDSLIAEDYKNSQVIKNMLQGRNIRKWYYNESKENLLFIPWHFPLENNNISGASIEAENALKEQYPSIYYRLSQYKKELVLRNKDETGIRYEWYALQRCAASYYDEFERSEKIIWGLTADKWAFTLDIKKNYLPSNAYILTSKHIPIRFILGLLNSKLLHYYFGFIGVMTAGGAYTLKAATIESLPIAIGTREQQKEIALKVESILNAKAADQQADVSSTENEIDHLVYELYGLSEKDIKIVEGF
ncbi:Eco57I restriction-modification methylase domain-containing protein [Prevotella melaninogenica]|nr:Eco57I restriction-modification methylase domain-containing protein [Prevotella melaninogenica]